MKITTRATSVAALGIATAALLAACSSSGTGGTKPSDGSRSGSGAASPTSSFTYGWSKPTGQNSWMNAIEAAATPVAVAAGGTGETTDAGIDVSTAVQQIGRFITDRKKVIVVAPAQVPQAVQATLERARSAGIATIGLEWSFNANNGTPPVEPIDGQVEINRGQLGKDVAAAINANFPNGAKVVYIGLPFPVAALDWFEKNLTGALGKSKIVANLDDPTDNAQGAVGPLNGALTAHPEADAIVTYNGPSAAAAVQAVAAAGLTGKVRIYNIQADSASIAALKAGTIAAVWDLDPPALGKALGEMIAAAGTGKPKSEWAKTVVVVAPKFTTATADTWKDWTK